MNKQFNWLPCPLCKKTNTPIRYPVDIKYIFKHSGVDMTANKIGVAICKNCAHQFIQPRPTSKFLSIFYSSYMSSAKSGFYRARIADQLPSSFTEYYSPWLVQIQNINQKPNLKLLDIGCGLGMFLRLAKEKGFDVRGIDPNAEAVEQLAKTHSIEAYNSLLEDYSAEETFDVVTMWDLLEHLAEPVTAIEKVYSILHAGGIVVLEIPIRDSLLHWVAKSLYWLSFGKISRPLFLTYGIHHLQYFSEKSIASFLETHGFEVIQGRRAETSLEALCKNSRAFKFRLYNISLQMMFWLARILGKQNKIVIIAKKPCLL